ncbi:MAG: hypothetical protein KJO31_08600 [Gammaproteobacteria bacterium]|nr:hypothetical protein [Gammaproteobacteria bacterium]
MLMDPGLYRRLCAEPVVPLVLGEDADDALETATALAVLPGADSRVQELISLSCDTGIRSIRP